MKRLVATLLLALPDGLTVEEFEKLRKELRPPAGEVWRTIPWKINLLEAREIATRQNKPIFIWAMDGNPLGCG